MAFFIIRNNKMIYISAQPDQVYFHWQVELYMYQFAKHGIKDQCYAVFGYTGDKPSEYIVNLSKKYKIFWYKDERNQYVPNFYIPSIRPHILKKFFAQYPELGKDVFYHDSDIFLVKIPILPADNYAYLSNTVTYIGYNYIKSCSLRYKNKYPELPDDDLFSKMCECAGISEELVKSNDLNSGGAQYLLRNIDAINNKRSLIIVSFSFY